MVVALGHSIHLSGAGTGDDQYPMGLANFRVQGSCQSETSCKVSVVGSGLVQNSAHAALSYSQLKIRKKDEEQPDMTGVMAGLRRKARDNTRTPMPVSEHVAAA